MIRLFFWTIVIAAGVWTGWYYTPAEIKGQILGFVGLASQRREVKNFIEDGVLPPDPEERREVVVKELKKNVGELKRRSIRSGTVEETALSAGEAGASPAIAAASTASVAAAADKLLDELEKSSGDKSLGGRIIERILERILPAPQCKE
jgi:DNA primase catalytic subunit